MTTVPLFILLVIAATCVRVRQLCHPAALNRLANDSNTLGIGPDLRLVLMRALQVGLIAVRWVPTVVTILSCAFVVHVQLRSQRKHLFFGQRSGA